MRYRTNKKKEALQNKLLLTIPMIITIYFCGGFLSFATGWDTGLSFIVVIPFILLGFYGIHKMWMNA